MLIVAAVCVSSLMVQEIKKIVKESEIMKYTCAIQSIFKQNLISRRL